MSATNGAGAATESAASKLNALVQIFDKNAKILSSSSQDLTGTSDAEQDARRSLLDASLEIQRLAATPEDFIEQLQINYEHLAAFDWLTEFDVLNHIPVNQTLSFEEVAKSAKVPTDRLRRVVRMAATSNILQEPTPGHVAHTRLSAQMIADPIYLAWVRYVIKYGSTSAGHFARADKKWDHSKEKNHTAWNLAQNVDEPLFVHVGKNKEMTADFAGYMKNMKMSEGLSLKHVLSGFDWASLGEGHVVDIGGSYGDYSILVASKYPSLRFTIQDLPETIDQAKQILPTLDPSIASRITFSAHSFWDPEPIRDADVYFLRRVLHDWPFAESQKILQHLAEALKPGAVIVIMDAVLPVPGSRPARQEAAHRVRDMHMAQSLNAKEREIGEWEELFNSTTPKLRLKSVNEPAGSQLSLLVATRDN
ncbi:MAG: hypothetical protein Q9165_000104 [Trypethelium subeluteriae]